jgi:hypothetical protein
MNLQQGVWYSLVPKALSAYSPKPNLRPQGDSALLRIYNPKPNLRPQGASVLLRIYSPNPKLLKLNGAK